MIDYRKSLCVNACNDIPTSTLESMVSMGVTLSGMIERKDAAIAELVAALKMYRRAGLGNSTDLELQAPAYLLGHDLIVKYDNPTKETK